MRSRCFRKIFIKINFIIGFAKASIPVRLQTGILAFDIFAHPSVREGLGLASLEAMASGLPLITSNVQGVPDYVENGITGYMCNPKDVDAYAENMNKLVCDSALREQIGTTNITYVQKYRVEEIQPVIKDILDTCVSEKETLTVG